MDLYFNFFLAYILFRYKLDHVNRKPLHIIVTLTQTCVSCIVSGYEQGHSSLPLVGIAVGRSMVEVVVAKYVVAIMSIL